MTAWQRIQPNANANTKHGRNHDSNSSNETPSHAVHPDQLALHNGETISPGSLGVVISGACHLEFGALPGAGLSRALVITQVTLVGVGELLELVDQTRTHGEVNGFSQLTLHQRIEPTTRQRWYLGVSIGEVDKLGGLALVTEGLSDTLPINRTALGLEHLDRKSARLIKKH